MPDFAGLRAIGTFGRLRGQADVGVRRYVDVERETVAARHPPGRIQQDWPQPIIGAREHDFERAGLVQIGKYATPVDHLRGKRRAAPCTRGRGLSDMRLHLCDSGPPAHRMRRV